MKKLRVLAMAAFAAISMSTTAQVTYGNDYQYQPEKNSKAQYGSDGEAFGTFYAQYNIASMRVSYEGHSNSTSLNGVTLGYNNASPLTDSAPLYLEYGVAAQGTPSSGRANGRSGYGPKEWTTMAKPSPFLAPQVL